MKAALWRAVRQRTPTWPTRKVDAAITVLGLVREEFRPRDLPCLSTLAVRQQGVDGLNAVRGMAQGWRWCKPPARNLQLLLGRCKTGERAVARSSRRSVSDSARD
jgi:hypothetical protein